MRQYSEYTNEYVQDICDVLNEAEVYKMLNEIDEHANRPFAPENFDTLTNFLQKYVVIPLEIYHFINDKGLVNRGRCPYTGQRIDNTFPKWTYMQSRSIYVSNEGYKIMKKEDDEDYEKIMGYPPPKIKTGGCYIATVCYGDEFSSEVLALKSYRDNVLANRWYGKLFIRTYYLVSPSIAKRLRNKTTLNSFIKWAFLDRIINKINDKRHG